MVGSRRMEFGTVARRMTNQKSERRMTMNTIIPIALVSMLVLGVVAIIVGGFFASTKEDSELDYHEQVWRETQEYLNNKYKEDYAKCRTQEDYDKLKLSVERGDYIAPPTGLFI